MQKYYNMEKGKQIEFVTDIINRALGEGLSLDRAFTEAAKAAHETGWG